MIGHRVVNMINPMIQLNTNILIRPVIIYNEHTLVMSKASIVKRDSSWGWKDDSVIKHLSSFVRIWFSEPIAWFTTIYNFSFRESNTF